MSDKVKMIDPPEGWKYGFPKPIPDHVSNPKQWLIDNGYPQSIMDGYGENFHCRYWEEEL